MGQEFNGKVVVVTGAGRGMGEAIAQKFASLGARVAAMDLNPADAQSTVDSLAGGDHLGLGCDVSNSESVVAAFEQVTQSLGAVDVLVNNAGIGRYPNDGSDEMYELMAKRNEELAAGGPATTHVDHLIFMQDEGWKGVMGVNIDGAFYCAREAVRCMVAANKGGSIVSISSTSAQSGEGAVHYCTSKAAIIGMTRCLAGELSGRGIRVNAVAPGPTNTPVMDGIPPEWIASMEADIPLGRMAAPAEIAEAVAWVSSDAASFCTGSVLVANGGSYFF